jgi:hypothetical protein
MALRLSAFVRDGIVPHLSHVTLAGLGQRDDQSGELVSLGVLVRADAAAPVERLPGFFKRRGQPPDGSGSKALSDGRRDCIDTEHLAGVVRPRADGGPETRAAHEPNESPLARESRRSKGADDDAEEYGRLGSVSVGCPTLSRGALSDDAAPGS